MRPLKLTFEGLNSFESRQQIDMSRLTGAHLFGIFGPTGAGKSTILDAMTLALYGEVVRAPHKTGGILNTRCDRLFVEFEFALGADDARVYRVTRSYMRSESGDALKARKCALVRIESGHEIVLSAEKPNDITQRVQQLLGLTMSDFVHSVVLPQGQFAEFLNMKGSERRSMLERLFHLEEFGRTLTERAKERETNLTMRVSEVDAALREVGDVTADELKAEKVKRELDSDELGRVERESESASREADGLRALYDLTQERKQWQVRKLAHDAERSRISLLTSELDAARRAEGILPIARELQVLENNRRELARSVRDSELALHQAVTLSEGLIKTSAEKKAQLAEERQRLQTQVGALDALAPRQAQMSQLSASERQMLDELGTLERSSADNDAALHDKEAAIEKGRAYVAELERVIAASAGADLEQLSRGADMERALEEQQVRYGEALAKLNATEAELERARVAQDAAKQAEREALKALNEARQASKRAEDEYLEGATRNAAARLARELGEGQPCPVCGSIHHPAPAREAELPHDGRAEAAARRDAAQSAYAEALKELARMGQATETLEQAQAEQSAQAEQLRAGLSAATAEWEQLCSKLGVRAMREAYAAALDGQSRSADANRRLAQARARLDTYGRQVQDYRMEQLKLHNRVDALKEKLADNHKLSSGWAGELSRLKLPADTDIVALLESTRERLARIEREFDKIDSALSSCQTRREEAGRRAASLKARLEQLTSQVTAQRDQLNSRLTENRFDSVEAAERAQRAPERIDELTRVLKADADEQLLIESNLKRLAQTAQDREVSEAEMSAANERAGQLKARVKDLTGSLGALERRITEMSARLKRRNELEQNRKKLGAELGCVQELRQVLRGNALVDYVANQYLEDITRMASERLMFLTGNRYALELGEDGFIVRDMERGGAERATSTLSGGETFLVSLALALALSLHINLRGQPLGFFFLDEGFGTLDERLLGTVMDALTMLARDNFSIGVISHVSALKERIPAQLIVSGGPHGSNAHIEFG